MDKLSIGLLVFFFSFCLIAFFCTSFNARKIFDFAKAKAKEKLKERQETNEKENDNEKEKEKGEYTGKREMRKHFAWYTAGMKYASGLRNEVNKVESYKELEQLCQGLT